MRQAVLSFRDETVAEWGFAPFQQAGLLDAEMLSCEGTRGVVRFHVEEPLDETRLEEMAVVQWWERVSNEDAEIVYLVGFEGANTGADGDIDADDLPPSEHIELTENGFELSYVGPQERIREAVAEFESGSNDVALRELGGYSIRERPLDALTDRQLEVLRKAFQNGYYEIPRGTTMDELAAELGVDDSTVAEHLHRAERNLITSVLGRTG